MTDDRCPRLDEILERLQAPDHGDEDVERHLASCPRCREAKEWLARVVDATTDGPLREPPEGLVQRAVGIADAEKGRERTLGWSLARLVADTFARPALAGVRGSVSGERRLLFETDAGAVDVEISPSTEDASACRVTAQVLDPEAPPDEGGVDAMLWAGERRAARVAADPTGVIVFDPVPPAEYRLEFLSIGAERAIRIESLDVSLEAG